MEKAGDELNDELSPDIAFRFYFLDKYDRLLDDGALISDVYFIRSVATVSASGGLTVSRALEAKVQEEETP